MSQPSTIIRCPACGHPINDHHEPWLRWSHQGCIHCGCEKTPNDIACALLFGELTPLPEIGKRPKDWSQARTGDYRPPLEKDWS